MPCQQDPKPDPRGDGRGCGFFFMARAALTDGTYPNMARVARVFERPGDVEEHFNFGLDTIVAGIAKLAR